MSLPQESHPDFFEILACPRAYTTAAFLLLSLGTGIFSFTFVTVGLSLSLGVSLLAVPVAYMLQARGSLDLEFNGLAQFGAHPASGVVLCLLLGVLFLPLSLHLAMALGRFQGWLARHLLIHA
jgi:hypothetical protein